MDDFIHVIYDCDTGETTTVPLTPEEIAQREADAAAAQADEQARQQALAAETDKRRQAADAVMSLFPNATPDQVSGFLYLAGITLPT